ncbi:MAG: Fasciclin domain protein [Euryarchaeota archaeon ADurb.BinA087]|nr:MAG: Fasciclin domain protein [Euryarchaeota archaeon ADurb.BinA087]
MGVLVSMKLHVLGIGMMVLLGAVLLCAGCTQPAPPATPTATPTMTPVATTVPEMKDIVQTAVADGRFTTLVTAVQAANLTPTLSGAGPFTVFAPTDEAFAKLPEGTVANLLKEPQGDLTQILLYHVVSGKLMAADVVEQTNLTTVGGKQLTITVENQTVMVDGAKVVITDIETKNGVIHVIDAVMIPAA